MVSTVQEENSRRMADWIRASVLREGGNIGGKYIKILSLTQTRCFFVNFKNNVCVCKFLHEIFLVVVVVVVAE